MQYRKSLVAAATAAAVLTSGVSVAPAAEPAPLVNKDTTTNQTTDKQSSSSSNDGTKLSPKEIQDWIAVATAVIGLVGTIAAFAQKYLRP